MFLLLIASWLYSSQCKKLDAQNDKAVTPVILVPGIFGSQLDGWYNKKTVPHYYCTKDSKTWTTLWLCVECMLPPTLPCWVDTMKLNISDVKNAKNVDGVQTKVNDFGYTDGISYLDKNRYVVQYEIMVEGFVSKLGYKRGVNIRGAPYDYRYSPTSEVGQMYMTRLKYLVEETYELNKNNRVMFIAHSMGNPYLVNFFKQMEQAWKDEYIAGYIAIAGVFGGSAKAIRALMSGETEDLPGPILNPLSMRDFQQTLPTIYWLMPPAKMWSDTTFVFANGRNYTAEQYTALMKDAKIPFGPAMYDTIKEVPLFEPDLGVDVYCIHGINQTTPFQFRYPPGGFPDSRPETINGNGDGTVNVRSLHLCKQFKRLKGYKAVDGVWATHLEILKRDDIIDYIVMLVDNNNRRLNGEHVIDF